MENSHQSSCEVSIVMPCLNEAATLESCIRKARTYLDANHLSGEIIVADNGSTDGSQKIAARAGARLMHIKEKGYGNALMGGIMDARGKYVIMGDADDSYDFSDLDEFIYKLRDGYDLVMGNRFLGGIKSGAMPFLHQYLGNPVLSSLGRLFFSSPCRDFHCGLRGFNKTAITSLGLRTTGMEFASEMVIKATLSGMKITEVPTVLYPDGRGRPPHLRTWRDGWRHLRFLLLYSPRWLFLYPGMLLMVLGLAVMLWLLPGPAILGGVTLDIHTLLYAALTITIGFQSVNFAVFAKVFAITEGLLPPDPQLDKLFRVFRLESGLVIGGGLIAAGLATSAYAFATWSTEAFGPLDPTRTFRLVIPASLAFTLGCQTVLSSFFLSLLGLRRR